MEKKKKRTPLLHPFFLAAYPVLFLLSNNLGQIGAEQAIRPLTITLVIALILILLFGIASKNLFQGSLSASLLLILFFSYGHAYRLIENSLPFLSLHLFLSTIWLFFLLAGIRLKWKLSNPTAITKALNFVSAMLLVLPVSNISIFLFQTRNNTKLEELRLFTDGDVHKTTNKSQPDIYYIIVDGYGRTDVLQELYGVDNSSFISNLESQGFFVASNSHSNYYITALSLASSLNMDYLLKSGKSQLSDTQLEEMIIHNQLRVFLEQQGYQTVAFQTGYEKTMMVDADIYYSYRPEFISELEFMLLASSATRVLDEKLDYLFNPYTCLGHYESILNTFSTLTQIQNLEGSHFTFVHILSPHPPFIFTENGELALTGECNAWDGNKFKGTSEEYKAGYEQQIKYITLLLQDTISQIINNSDPPPIIILQGDHGPGLLTNWESARDTCLRERTSILNAYYFPEGNYDDLYSFITPVNSFRVVLNNHFGQDFPLLEDKIYFSQDEDVTDKIELSCNIQN